MTRRSPKRGTKRMKRTPDKTQNEKISHDISPYFHRNSSYIPRLLALEEAIPSAHVQHVLPSASEGQRQKKEGKSEGRRLRLRQAVDFFKAEKSLVQQSTNCSLILIVKLGSFSVRQVYEHIISVSGNSQCCTQRDGGNK